MPYQTPIKLMKTIFMIMMGKKYIKFIIEHMEYLQIKIQKEMF